MTRTGLLSGLLLAGTAAVPAQAQTPAFSVSGTLVPLPGDQPFNFGYAFTLSEAFTASALGLFDEDGDGLASPHEIGLWDSSGTLLASTLAYGTAGTPSDGFRYTAIAPLQLGPGSYTIGATYLDGLDRFQFLTTITPLSGVTFDAELFIIGGTLTRPTHGGDYGGGFFGPNLLLSAAVPEPAAWALMLLGFGAAAGALRAGKRRQQVAVTYA